MTGALARAKTCSKAELGCLSSGQHPGHPGLWGILYALPVKWQHSLAAVLFLCVLFAPVGYTAALASRYVCWTGLVRKLPTGLDVGTWASGRVGCTVGA